MKTLLATLVMTFLVSGIVEAKTTVAEPTLPKTEIIITDPTEIFLFLSHSYAELKDPNCLKDGLNESLAYYLTSGNKVVGLRYAHTMTMNQTIPLHVAALFLVRGPGDTQNYQVGGYKRSCVLKDCDYWMGAEQCKQE